MNKIITGGEILAKMSTCKHPAFFTNGRCLDCGQVVFADCITVTVNERGATKSVDLHLDGCSLTLGKPGSLRCGFDKPDDLVARQKAAYAKAMEEFWCQCGPDSVTGDYVPDGAHAHCHKHHYDCERCGKVVQTG